MVKRFINADSYASTGQGFLGYNMFAYCGNNPVSHTDETGEFFWIIGVVHAGVSFVSTLATGGDFGDACINAGISFATAGFE